MRLTLCLLNTSESLQTKFIVVAHLAEEQFLKNELTRSKGKSRRCRVDTRITIMSMEEQD